MEYLLLPENADKIMNSIDRPEIIIIKTTTSIKLMPCSSDMIFPRLNALSYRLVFNSLIIMFLSMFIDGDVNAGQISHAPSPIIKSSRIIFLYHN